MSGRAYLMTITLVIVAACGGEASIDSATKAVADFRVQFHEKDFNGIYDRADPEFRKGTSKADWALLMNAVSARLGQIRSASDPAWHVNVGTGGTLVRLDYESEFYRGKANETFVWRLKGSEARLVGYHVNSLALVTNDPAPAN